MALDKFTQITKSGIVTTINFECHHLHSTGIATFSSGSISAVDGTFTGDVSIGGTLTYQDVTNIDSVGLVTARLGINVTAGVSTFAAAIDANGGVDISGGNGLVASTAKISDLTDNRVVIGGSSGELEDSANLTFDGSNLGVGSKVTITNANADADNPNSLGADINAAWIRIGDNAASKSFSNGLGIKFYDQGTAHWSAGTIGNKFYIAQTSNDGNKLFPSGRTDAVTIDSTGKVGIGTITPSVKLHVYDGSIRSSNTAGTNFTELGSDGNIEIKRTGGSAYIDFADAISNDADCRIQHVSDGFEFSTGGQGSRTTKLGITSDGSVNLGTGELTQTARKFNVYGGAARVTQTAGGNTIEAFGHSTSGQSYGLLVNAGSTSGDYCANFRNKDATTLLRIRGDGNVGINESSPNRLLYISDDSNTAYSSTAGSNGAVLRLHNKNGTDNSGVNNQVGIEMYVANGATTVGMLSMVRTGNNVGDFTYKTRTGSSSYAERLRIDSSGKLGLGMSSHQQSGLKGKLDIDASGIDAAGDFDDPNDYAIVIRNSSTTNEGNGIAFTNDGGQHVGGAIIHIDKGSNNLGDLAFYTAATSSNPEERLRITSGGVLCVGATAADGDEFLRVKNKLLVMNTGNLGDAFVKIKAGESGGSVLEFEADEGDDYADLWRIQNAGDGLLGFRTKASGSWVEKFQITSTGQLQATGAADVRLTLGSSGSAGTNNSVHVRADSANLKFMAASGGNTIFETNGTETLRIDSSGKLFLGHGTYNSNSDGYKMSIKESSNENAMIIFLDTDNMRGGFCGIVKGANQVYTGTTNVDFLVGSTYANTTIISGNGSNSTGVRRVTVQTTGEVQSAAGGFVSYIKSDVNVSIDTHTWSSNTYYRVVNDNVLNDSASTYLVNFHWSHEGAGSPWIIRGNFLWTPTGANHNGAVGKSFIPVQTAHSFHGPSRYFTFQGVANGNVRQGLQAKVDSGWSPANSNGHGVLHIRITRIADDWT